MTVADAMRDRMLLDAAAIASDAEAREVFDVLSNDDVDLDELDELDQVLERIRAGRPVWVATPALIAALASECDAWLHLVDDERLVLEIVNQVRRGMPTRAGAPRPGDLVEYRELLEEARGRARASVLEHSPEEVGWIAGVFAEPGDVQGRIEATRTEVDGVLRELEELDDDQANDAAVLEFQAWAESFAEWLDQDPSTFWAGSSTLNDLDEWDAQLAGHRQRLDRALGARLATETPARSAAPIGGLAERAGEAIESASSGIGMGLGLVFGLVVIGGGIYFASQSGAFRSSR